MTRNGLQELKERKTKIISLMMADAQEALEESSSLGSDFS
jgi:hypothetical protein